MLELALSESNTLTENMKKIISTLFISSLVAGSASASVILNNSFESSFDDWTVVDTSANLSRNATDLGGATYNGDATAGGGSALGTNRAFANLNGAGQSSSLTAFVYVDGTLDNTGTKETIAAGQYAFTMAIGNKDGGNSYDDNGDIELTLGYLTTADDISSFTSFESLSMTAAAVKTAITENTWADITVIGTVRDTDVAIIGSQLAVQFTTTRTTVGVNNNNQTSFDYARVASVPEPSTYALLAGLFGLGHVMVRRRRS